jgi:tungstate transport system substrate-binding protein
MTTLTRLLAGAAFVLAPLSLAAQEAEFITVASTTSTEQSGLFGHILPMFEEETGIEVRVVAQGTGQALETGRRGDADVVFVHARAQESSSWPKATASSGSM